MCEGGSSKGAKKKNKMKAGKSIKKLVRGSGAKKPKRILKRIVKKKK